MAAQGAALTRSALGGPLPDWPEGSRGATACSRTFFVCAFPESEEKALFLSGRCGLCELWVEGHYGISAYASLAERRGSGSAGPKLYHPVTAQAEGFGKDIFPGRGSEDCEVQRRAVVEFLAGKLVVHLHRPGAGRGIIPHGTIGFGLDDAEGDGRGLSEE